MKGMGFKCGLVGMPNVGKSSIFNLTPILLAIANKCTIALVDPPIAALTFIAFSNAFLVRILDNFKKIGDEYIAKMKAISNNSDRATDKLPINFLYIGFIKLILPKSKIVHCYRNPKDNCLSVFTNYFSGKKIKFAYDMSEVVDYYNLYND